MKTMAATDAKTNFGKLLDAAQRGPVRITRKDRSVAVVMSEEDFACYEALENAHWARLADASVRRGDLLTAEETAAAFEEILGPVGAALARP